MTSWPHTGSEYQDIWQLLLQVWGQTSADGHLSLRELGPGPGVWHHKICLSNQVRRGTKLNPAINLILCQDKWGWRQVQDLYLAFLHNWDSVWHCDSVGSNHLLFAFQVKCKRTSCSMGLIILFIELIRRILQKARLSISRVGHWGWKQ